MPNSEQSSSYCCIAHPFFLAATQLICIHNRRRGAERALDKKMVTVDIIKFVFLTLL
jgi:hypothetical protein